MGKIEGFNPSKYGKKPLKNEGGCGGFHGKVYTKRPSLKLTASVFTSFTPEK